jgi:D-alanyl-D-alanine carboxypeptidase
VPLPAASSPSAPSSAPGTSSPVPSSSVPSSPVPSSSASPSPARPSPTERYDIDDPHGYTVIVNKARPFDPQDYAPDDLVSVPVPFVNAPLLRKRASDAVVAMFADFEAETGLAMQSQSAYRSYDTQVRVYAGWVDSLGRKAADLTSARPGYSEHQTGLAIDISAKPAACSLDQCFADTPQGEWLAEHAWEYGFVLRFPKGQTDVTGYEFEPWHYRFVGRSLARSYEQSGARTLEEYFGLPAAPDYLR